MLRELSQWGSRILMEAGTHAYYTVLEAFKALPELLKLIIIWLAVELLNLVVMCIEASIEALAMIFFLIALIILIQ